MKSAVKIKRGSLQGEIEKILQGEIEKMRTLTRVDFLHLTVLFDGEMGRWGGAYKLLRKPQKTAP